MRRKSPRWLWVAGFLAATGGCRHAEGPQSGMPVVGEEPGTAGASWVAPQEAPAGASWGAPPSGPRLMPSSPPEAGVRVSSLKPAGQRPAAPGQGHAPDHSWVVGRLERDGAKDRWYVRYAAAAEPEAFGGRLELVRTGPMADFHVGQAVRVHGTLVDPMPLETCPAYRVLSLQPVRE